MASSNPYTAPQAEVSDVGDAYHGAFQKMKIWGWRGRLGRLRYLAYGVVSYFIYLVLISSIGVFAAFSGTKATSATAMVVGIAVWVLLIPYLVFWVSVLIRRSHDMGWSGWTSLLGLIPLVGLIWLFKGGSPGANEYGAPPPPNTTGVKLAAFGLLGVMVIGIMAAVALPAYQQYILRAKAAQQVQSK